MSMNVALFIDVAASKPRSCNQYMRLTYWHLLGTMLVRIYLRIWYVLFAIWVTLSSRQGYQSLPTFLPKRCIHIIVELDQYLYVNVDLYIIRFFSPCQVLPGFCPLIHVHTFQLFATEPAPIASLAAGPCFRRSSLQFHCCIISIRSAVFRANIPASWDFLSQRFPFLALC